MTFSAKGNMEVFKIKHHGPVRSRGCVGGDGQCCDFPKFFHLVEEPVAQISPAPGFVLCTYKEETSLAQKKATSSRHFPSSGIPNCTGPETSVFRKSCSHYLSHISPLSVTF